MSHPRIAIVFDNLIRPDTTGIYCLRALRDLASVVHFLPQEQDLIQRKDFDVALSIDDGLDYALQDRLRPWALWAIDTHIAPRRILERARQADRVFAAQRQGCRLLESQGIPHVQWLPLAADAAIHGDRGVARKLDWAFVGHLGHERRADLLQALQKARPNGLVGRAWFEDMAGVYSRAKIGFNCSVADDLNMRVFEAMAAGSMLLTNRIEHSGLEDLFKPGVHFDWYADEEELLRLMHSHLADDAARRAIALAGRRAVLEHHTYHHRMKFLLQSLDPGAQPGRSPAGPPSPGGRHLGCVLAIRDRPADILDWTLRSYASQERQPLDRLVLDFGSQPALAAVYESICGRHGWRFVRINPPIDEWNLALAYNLAVGLLDRRVDVVFKCDVDVLVGPGLLDLALRLGRDRLCVFTNILTTTDATPWPSTPAESADFDTLLASLKPLEIMESDGFHAFPRDWFERVGGYDLSLRGWGFDDSDLRSRAAQSIGVRESSGAALLHQWHPRPIDRRSAAANRAHFLAQRQRGAIVRNDAQPRPAHWRQWVERGNAPPPRTDAVVSIVIVTCNQLEYTRLCVDSILEHTTEPYELIFVDNGSQDGTLEYLRGIPFQEKTLVSNAANLGFPAAANQGINESKGDFVVLLNNDTIVTPHWLEHLLEAMSADDRVGLAGPCSNEVSGPQRVASSYATAAELPAFARQWATLHRGQRTPVDRLVGFCLMVRKAVFAKVGLLDERFGIGNFEDDDLCRRAMQQGYASVIARACFVHHFGSRTFAAMGVDYAQLLRRNEELYREKWDLAAAGFEPSWEPTTTSAGVLLTDRRPHLSLCMIVRDNAEVLEPCLSSIYPWVDELVVVDTGSRDGTRDIARRYGARVYEFPWCDDFSAARNESLRHARGRWIFWMDSDDTISAENGRRLRDLSLQSAPPSLMGYVLQVHCPGGREPHSSVTAVDHIKLILNHPGIRFEGRIHEQVLPSIRRIGADVAFTDVFVVHSGSDPSPQGRRIKQARDLRLLELDLLDRPDHPFVLFNLGMTCVDAERYAEAVTWLRRSIAAAGPGESHLRKAHALLVESLARLNRKDEAAQACQAALDEFPLDAELLFHRGVAAYDLNDDALAVSCFQKVIDNRDPRHFSSVDQSLFTYKVRHNQALAQQRLGRTDEAQTNWRWVIAAYPSFLPAWLGLHEALLRQGNHRDADDLAGQMMARGWKTEGTVGLAGAAAAQGHIGRADALLRALVQERPGEEAVQRAWCEHLFVSGDPDEAIGALGRLALLCPADGSVYHNIGALHLRMARGDLAVAALEQSLKLRSSQATRELLDRARASGATPGNQASVDSGWAGATT